MRCTPGPLPGCALRCSWREDEDHQLPDAACHLCDAAATSVALEIAQRTNPSNESFAQESTSLMDWFSLMRAII